MARYYFHIRCGQATILDHWGVELSDLVEAYKEAARRAHEIERQEALERVPWSNRAIIVDDEFSTVLEVALPNSRRDGLAALE